MLKLIEKYRSAATTKNAQAIRAYDRKHPMASCLLKISDQDLVAEAIHRANMGEP